jgi:hypothetical protein
MYSLLSRKNGVPLLIKATKMDPIIGGAMISAGANIGSGLMGLLDIGGNRMRKKQLEQQQKLTDMQVQANKELANHGMGISKEMFEATGYGAQRRQMEEAGLNPALMYGHAGAGGSTTSASGGSATGAHASDEASLKQAQMAQQGMALQLAKLGSEIAVNKATAKEKEANAGLASEKSTTEADQRDILIEKLRQEGVAQWFENLESDVKRSGTLQDGEVRLFRNAKLDVSTAFKKVSLWNQEVTTAIAKTMAEIGNIEAQELLTNNKAQGYWQELLNATKQADADAVRAAAVKLSTEWETGEFTNWRTWAELGIQAVNTVANAVSVAKKPNIKANPRTPAKK